MSVVVLAATLSACGDPASNDIVVAGDDCSYAGPTTLDAGPVTVALHLTSLRHNKLILAALEEGHSYSDLEAHLEESPDAITERPSWVVEIVTLELEHGGGERDGTSEELDLPEGTHALICIDHWGFAGAGPTAKAIGEITASST